MGVLMVVLICGMIGLCQGSLVRENITMTAYGEETRNRWNDGAGESGSRSYGNSNYNPGTNRPPSGINYLEFIDFEDPSGDEMGFRLHMSMDNSEHWNQIMDEATIAVDDGYEVEKILKPIEIDDFWEAKRWIDFTKFSCNPQTQSISVHVKDIHHREKVFEIPNDLLFGREAIITRVESVQPEDEIQLWTRSSVKSHCFHGGSVTVEKNGRHLMEAEISFSYGQYAFILNDGPGTECQVIQYDLAITSRYGRSLGMAKIGREDNRISLDLEGKVVTMNTLDGFLYCTSRSASITEISDPSSKTIQSNMRRQFSLHPFLITCKEAVLHLEYIERGRHSLEIVHVPRVVSVDKPSDEIREVKIGDEDFQNCADTKIELQCYEDNVGSFVSIQNFTTTSFSVKPYLEKTCRIRAWISQRYAQYAEFYTILDPLSTMEWILIGVGIGVVVLVIIVVIGVCLARKKSSGSRRGDRGAGAEMVQLRSSNRIKTEDETG